MSGPQEVRISLISVTTVFFSVYGIKFHDFTAFQQESLGFKCTIFLCGVLMFSP